MAGKRELCSECGTRFVCIGKRGDLQAAASLRLCRKCYGEKALLVNGREPSEAERGNAAVRKARLAKEEGIAVAAEVFAEARAGAGRVEREEETERFEERFLATMMWIFVGEKPEKIVRRLRGAADYVERAFVKKGARR